MQSLNDKVILHCGDCIDVLATLSANSIDSCVTDPPYHLVSIQKRFANAKAESENYAINKSKSAYMSRGFMGKQWDGGDIAFRPETWAAVYRVLKPGAHLLAFGGTRTYHRMACAIEDAGFEIRDCIMWLYGSGFPKSHDVSKGIDGVAGAERKIVGRYQYPDGKPRNVSSCPNTYLASKECGSISVTSPATDAARQWQGWGTALKPACEPIVLARKPLSEKAVAANVLKWGTGAINVDGCRVEGQFKSGWSDSGSKAGENTCMSGPNYEREAKPDNINGRWPANVIHDGSEEVVGAFPDAGGGFGKRGGNKNSTSYGFERGTMEVVGDGDEGSAARFFYTAKADSDDRLGSKHPTVKPLDLMQYLVRLVTPKGGTVLDPFAGTGTTGEAAWREGMNAILIEKEYEYQEDIKRRVSLCLSGPDERAREAIKARIKDKQINHGPLFDL